MSVANQTAGDAPLDTAAAELTANLEAQPDDAYTILVVVDPAARSDAITKGRTREARIFEVK